jgi:uncharacterized protein
MAKRFPIRQLCAALILVGFLIVLWWLLAVAGQIQGWLHAWQNLPWPVAAGLYVVIAAVGAFCAWAIWRLLRPIARVAGRSLEPPTSQGLLDRAQNISSRPQIASTVARELAQLEHRAQSSAFYIAFFGEISSGKSALIRTMSGDTAIKSDARGGTTHSVKQYELTEGDGAHFILADVPGTDEVGGERYAVMAREEALRAHVVVYVMNGDVSRSQFGDIEFLRFFAKPMLIAINKADLYTDEELLALRTQLHTKLQLPVVLASAGATLDVLLEHADGRREAGKRQQAADVVALRAAIAHSLARGRAALEVAREQAVLRSVAIKLDDVERGVRDDEARQLLGVYGKRAMVGAMAAVAPGTDIVIQGALAIAFLRELTTLYGVRLRDVELESVVRGAGKKLRHSSALMLAVVGNALKAFPGLGTLGGGVVHAVAYGLLFQSFGRAMIASLQATGRLDNAEVLRQLDFQLAEKSSLGPQALILAQALMQRPAIDPPPTKE